MAVESVEYYPEGTIVAVYPDGDFNSQPAIGRVCSNRAHLWNGIGKPYWIHVQEGEAPNQAFRGYVYALHHELRVIKEATADVQSNRKSRRNRKQVVAQAEELRLATEQPGYTFD
jgi:hypothetical protein